VTGAKADGIPDVAMERPRYVRWFGELRSEDVAQVGGKNASLGDPYSALSEDGPNGFALTAQA
jgi:pyruvate,water dikinase